MSVSTISSNPKAAYVTEVQDDDLPKLNLPTDNAEYKPLLVANNEPSPTQPSAASYTEPYTLPTVDLDSSIDPPNQVPLHLTRTASRKANILGNEYTNQIAQGAGKKVLWQRAPDRNTLLEE